MFQTRSLLTMGKSKLERRESLGFWCSRGEFTGEDAAGERTPDEQSGLFGFEQRHDVALEVAPGERVVGLQGVEAGEVLELGDAEGLAIFQACQLETPM